MGFKNILIWDTSCRGGQYKGRESTHNRNARLESTLHPGNTPGIQVPQGAITLQPEDRSHLLFEDNEPPQETCNPSNGYCEMIRRAAVACYRGICGKDKTYGGRTKKRKTKKNKTRKLRTKKVRTRKNEKRI
jgi:hypothetical protein